jgi:glycosyltransferase involved in cell wall biosynthesis
VIGRVLHVIPSVGPLRGGPSALVRSLAHDLAREGIETHVATTDDNVRERLQVPLGVPVDVDGVTYWYFSRQTSVYTFSWPLTRWMASHVSAFDVVHIHSLFSYPSLAAAFWARRRGVPYVVGPLGTLNEWGMKNRRRWLKRLSFHLFESQVIRSAACAVYASDQERVEAERLRVPVRPIVVPHAVPDAFDTRAVGQFLARYPHLRGSRLVLFLSRLDPKKGLDLLLPAFALLRQQMPDILLVVAGTGETGFVRGLMAQAAALGIQSAVLWPGFLDGNEKQAAFADVDLFVLPSYSENFGIAAVEAMAAGLPVLVSDQVGIHSEITQARAGLAVACDVGQLTDALALLLNDSALRRSMGEDGRALVREKYSSEAVTRKLIGVYNQIAASRSAESDSRQSADHQMRSN